MKANISPEKLEPAIEGLLSAAAGVLSKFYSKLKDTMKSLFDYINLSSAKTVEHIRNNLNVLEVKISKHEFNKEYAEDVVHKTNPLHEQLELLKFTDKIPSIIEKIWSHKIPIQHNEYVHWVGDLNHMIRSECSIMKATVTEHGFFTDLDFYGSKGTLHQFGYTEHTFPHLKNTLLSACTAHTSLAKLLNRTYGDLEEYDEDVMPVNMSTIQRAVNLLIRITRMLFSISGAIIHYGYHSAYRLSLAYNDSYHR
jgi:hypothetical protein